MNKTQEAVFTTVQLKILLGEEALWVHSFKAFISGYTIAILIEEDHEIIISGEVPTLVEEVAEKRKVYTNDRGYYKAVVVYSGEELVNVREGFIKQDEEETIAFSAQVMELRTETITQEGVEFKPFGWLVKKIQREQEEE